MYRGTEAIHRKAFCPTWIYRAEERDDLNGEGVNSQEGARGFLLSLG